MPFYENGAQTQEKIIENQFSQTFDQQNYDQDIFGNKPYSQKLFEKLQQTKKAFEMQQSTNQQDLIQHNRRSVSPSKSQQNQQQKKELTQQKSLKHLKQRNDQIAEFLLEQLQSNLNKHLKQKQILQSYQNQISKNVEQSIKAINKKYKNLLDQLSALFQECTDNVNSYKFRQEKEVNDKVQNIENSIKKIEIAVQKLQSYLEIQNKNEQFFPIDQDILNEAKKATLISLSDIQLKQVDFDLKEMNFNYQIKPIRKQEEQREILKTSQKNKNRIRQISQEIAKLQLPQKQNQDILFQSSQTQKSQEQLQQTKNPSNLQNTKENQNYYTKPLNKSQNFNTKHKSHKSLTTNHLVTEIEDRLNTLKQDNYKKNFQAFDNLLISKDQEKFSKKDIDQNQLQGLKFHQLYQQEEPLDLQGEDDYFQNQINIKEDEKSSNQYDKKKDSENIQRNKSVPNINQVQGEQKNQFVGKNKKSQILPYDQISEIMPIKEQNLVSTQFESDYESSYIFQNLQIQQPNQNMQSKNIPQIKQQTKFTNVNQQTLQEHFPVKKINFYEEDNEKLDEDLQNLKHQKANYGLEKLLNESDVQEQEAKQNQISQKQISQQEKQLISKKNEHKQQNKLILETIESTQESVLTADVISPKSLNEQQILKYLQKQAQKDKIIQDLVQKCQLLEKQIESKSSHFNQPNHTELDSPQQQDINIFNFSEQNMLQRKEKKENIEEQRQQEDFKMSLKLKQQEQNYMQRNAETNKSNYQFEQQFSAQENLRKNNQLEETQTKKQKAKINYENNQNQIDQNRLNLDLQNSNQPINLQSEKIIQQELENSHNISTSVKEQSQKIRVYVPHGYPPYSYFYMVSTSTVFYQYLGMQSWRCFPGSSERNATLALRLILYYIKGTLGIRINCRLFLISKGTIL